jgi:dTDP-4-dehydrorhamnose reductase
MIRVAVLGGSGMLGSMIVDLLARQPDLAVSATARDETLRARFAERYPEVAWRLFRFDGTGADPAPVLDGHAWIINAIGITKPLIRDDQAGEIEQAVEVNARLPHVLGRRAAGTGARVLQIATDCVYSGATGRYTEDAVHDALDVYGKTKSLGETYHPAVHHLRCSIIGPEPKDFKFLIEWFRRQPRGARVNGFVNHQWNGVTTLHFAKLCLGIIRHDLPLPHLQHVVPDGCVTKAGMLHTFADAYDRRDIRIADVEATSVIDRTLHTRDPEANLRLWEVAGYPAPPAVPDMIHELAHYPYRAALS